MRSRWATIEVSTSSSWVLSFGFVKFFWWRCYFFGSEKGRFMAGPLSSRCPLGARWHSKARDLAGLSFELRTKSIRMSGASPTSEYCRDRTLTKPQGLISGCHSFRSWRHASFVAQIWCTPIFEVIKHQNTRNFHNPLINTGWWIASNRLFWD